MGCSLKISHNSHKSWQSIYNDNNDNDVDVVIIDDDDDDEIVEAFIHV